MLDRESAIRRRAYEIWQTEGCDGSQEEHWLRAEAEMTVPMAASTKRRGAGAKPRAASASRKASGKAAARAN